jgi:outer membrane protein OmpA-like peptidoglycan-associated protein
VIITLDPFVTGSAVLLPRMKVQLINLAKTIKKDIGKSVVITGFTDSRSAVAYNLALGLARATSANVYLRAQLERLGVKINFSIQVITKGLTSPAASNTTSTGEAKNRRVVLVAMLY